MKNKIKILFAIIALSLTSCTGDFDEINVNPDHVPE